MPVAPSPKKDRRPPQTPIPKLNWTETTAASAPLQPCPAVQEFAAPPVRRCVVCGVPVENLNLGGHDAPSAFRGPLWCLRCADGRSPQ